MYRAIKYKLIGSLFINAVQKSKNDCGANDLSVTVISSRKCHEKCVYLHHNGFFIFKQRLDQYRMILKVVRTPQ
jgi:hypothetical protein